ncbi:vacuolar protein sorting-associated protein 54, partial [Clonorchis sinensis]
MDLGAPKQWSLDWHLRLNEEKCSAERSCNSVSDLNSCSTHYDVNAYWDEIATSLHSAGNFACGTAPPGALKHWISDRTVALLKSRRNIPAGPEHNLVRRIIRRQVKVSVKADREVWWTQKAKEMEEAQKSGNALRLFQLIRATGPRKPPVSETIKDRNGVTISNKEERLDRWAEYFEQQLSWPPAGAHLEPTGDGFKPAGLLDKSREPYVFDSPQEFVSHLKLKHLTIKATSDGKIYICCYGPSGTCLSRSLSDLASVNGTSLSPSSFLSQKEYEKHLVSSHLLPEIADMAKPQSTHANGRRSPVRWSVLQSAVNLPAVLNDPTHRQIDIFSRTWGEQFERAEVLPSPTLPVITEKDFEHYLSKLGFRGNWASSAASPSLSSSKPNVLLQAVRSTTPSRNFPTNTPIAWPEDANTNRPQSLDSIPLVFFEHGFTLAHPKTFSQVIPLHPRDTTATGGLLPNITSFLNGCEFTTEHSWSSQKQQEHDFYAQHDRLANYLDVVEVHLAEQVSKKSSIFFEAVCCHDVVREKLSEALNQVRLVRQKLHQVDSTINWAAMRLHRVVRRKAHYRLILEKVDGSGLDCHTNGLQLFGGTSGELTHINEFCGTGLPQTITEDRKELTLFLTTDSTNTGKSFKATLLQ